MRIRAVLAAGLSTVVWIAMVAAVAGAAEARVLPGVASAGSLADPAGRRTSVALPAGTSSDWWAGVRKDIAATEYEITWQDQTSLPDQSAAYQAPNRAQDLRTYFTLTGVTVIPRTRAGGWRWGLSLLGFGDTAQPMVAANRIEYRRGTLTEWYVNDERGLEQGFTIASPLGSEGSLELDLALSGDLTPALTGDGQAIDFATPDGGPWSFVTGHCRRMTPPESLSRHGCTWSSGGSNSASTRAAPPIRSPSIRSPPHPTGRPRATRPRLISATPWARPGTSTETAIPT